MTKSDELKKIKKSEIHKSALELFSEKGYYQTSIEDITKKLTYQKVYSIIIISAKMHYLKEL